MNKFEKTLSTGTISITAASNQHLENTWPLEALFEFAERVNPKRSFLFVSKVLGRHIPVSPAVIRHSYRSLAAQLPDDLPTPVLFIGMAETAVGLAAGVFEEARKRYPHSLLMVTTRHEMQGDLLCEFKEEHSHATDHLLYFPNDPTVRELLAKCKTLVLIDDEITTGNTFKNLSKALQEANLSNLTHVVTAVLTDWSGGTLQDKFDLPLQQIALAHGQWHWQPFDNAKPLTQAVPPIPKKTREPISSRQDWGRLGLTNYQNLTWLARVNADANERILVLGTGEFVYPPFLLAEHLEQQGATVVFSATTRSPIAQGFAIESRLAFADNYGLNIANYCYNIAHQRFDRILLCLETQVETVDPNFLQALEHIAAKVEVVIYD